MRLVKETDDLLPRETFHQHGSIRGAVTGACLCVVCTYERERRELRRGFVWFACLIAALVILYLVSGCGGAGQPTGGDAGVDATAVQTDSDGGIFDDGASCGALGEKCCPGGACAVGLTCGAAAPVCEMTQP